MLRHCVAFLLAIPLCGHGQSYADAPFYRPASAVPSTARVEGYEHGGIRANGVVIDLSDAAPESSPDFDQLAGWDLSANTDEKKPAQRFHYYLQYDRLQVAFAYDLLVEPVEGTDKIRCTFSTFSGPPPRFAAIPWSNREIVPVALPADLTPVVIRSGDVISITMLPLGKGRIAVVHYLRLTRTDLTADATQQASSR